jgi:hypothetical protein
MRFASIVPASLMVLTALGCAVACSGDDDDSAPSSGGSASQAGAPSTQAGSPATGEGGGAALADSQLCTDLGGPIGIDGVVRGDGKKATTAEPFNAFKFEKDGRQASVLLNVATDPCIGQQFAHLLLPGAEADLEHLAECLSLYVQNAAGCAVEYDGSKDKAGKACKSMTAAHVGRGITEEDYSALILDAATALQAAGVKSGTSQFNAVAGALTAQDLKQEVITNDAAEFSNPAPTCDAAVGGMTSTGAGGMSGGGAGGAP